MGNSINVTRSLMSDMTSAIPPLLNIKNSDSTPIYIMLNGKAENEPNFRLIRQLSNVLNDHGFDHKRLDWNSHPRVVLRKRELKSIYRYTTIIISACKLGFLKLTVISDYDWKYPQELYFKASSPFAIIWNMQDRGIYDFRKGGSND